MVNEPQEDFVGFEIVGKEMEAEIDVGTDLKGLFKGLD